MKTALVIIATLLGAQAALAETGSSADQISASVRPVLGTVSGKPTTDRAATTKDAPFYVRQAMLAKVPVKTWSAQVEYQHVIDRPDLLAASTRNEETARPGFATLQRSFGTGDFRPYLGVGVGVAATQFDGIAPSEEGSYAVKGVVGSNLIFTENVGAYVQYDYAVATQDEAATGDRKSHGLSFGLRISLQ
jgi:hypothetical protein